MIAAWALVQAAVVLRLILLRMRAEHMRRYLEAVRRLRQARESLPPGRLEQVLRRLATEAERWTLPPLQLLDPCYDALANRTRVRSEDQ
jgi:hypothetical protein